MSSHLTATDIDRYRSKAITADEVRVLDSHLSECEDCRRSFLDSKSVDVAYSLVSDSLRSAPKSTETHIEYEEMAAYADDALDAAARDIVEAHIRACKDCKNDVAELMSLKEAIASDEQTAVDVSQPSVPFWQTTAFRISLEALAVLLIIVGVVWFSSRQIKSLRTENEQLRRSASESESVIAELEHHIESFKLAGPAGPTVNDPEITRLKDGEGFITLDVKGALGGVEGLSEEHRDAVKKLLETGRVSLPPVIAQLRGSLETRMTGNTDEHGFRLLKPLGTVVETTQPTLRWMKFSDAIHYEVSVSNADGEVVQRTTVYGADWRPAAALARGQVYQWQVRAITRNGQEIKSPPVGQPDAKFRVLDQNTFNELELARKGYPHSHLVLGTVYAKAGLINEARREFRALLDANPESQISRRILASLTRR